MDRLIEAIGAAIERNPMDVVAYEDMLSAYENKIKAGEAEWHGENRKLRDRIVDMMNAAAAEKQYAVVNKFGRQYERSLLISARVEFDCFLQYLEIHKPIEDRFYLPRRKVLRPIVTAFQEVADGKLDLLTVSQPKRTGKSTLGTWFVLFRAGNAPNGSSVCCGAGDMLVKSFYNGMYDILTQKDKYTYYDIFPEAKLVATNADEKTLNLKDKTRFATVTCRSIDGALTGSTEATPDGVMYLDDLVANETEATNRTRLDFLWDKVRGDLLGRRLEGCPIVAQGTRYSLYDPIGKLQEVAPTMGWRTKVVEIPALDPATDESNFEITIKGKKMFTTEYYQHERELVTEMQWESQFQQQPFEAKGRLFPEDELNRFIHLPEREPDAIVAACDTAEKGSDSVCLPVGYVYGDDVMIVDCVFDNSTPEHTKPECANMLIKHKVPMAQFESNSAGEYYARDVGELCEKQGYKLSIRLKRHLTNKVTRIEVESDNILKHFFFLDKSLYKPNSQYGMMIKEMTSFTRSGKVAHDDSVDGLAQLSALIRTLTLGKVEVMQRPW